MHLKPKKDEVLDLKHVEAGHKCLHLFTNYSDPRIKPAGRTERSILRVQFTGSNTPCTEVLKSLNLTAFKEQKKLKQCRYHQTTLHGCSSTTTLRHPGNYFSSPVHRKNESFTAMSYNLAKEGFGLVEQRGQPQPSQQPNRKGDSLPEM